MLDRFIVIIGTSTMVELRALTTRYLRTYADLFAVILPMYTEHVAWVRT